MKTWNGSQLERIGAAEELELRSERGDGTLRNPVTMWVVRAGDHVYVRSVKGQDGPWYRGTRTREQGDVEAGGVRQDVTFNEADPREYAGVDAAYREKYGHYTTIVDHVLTDRARTSTLRLEPR
ncbi:DUF2255 family protein [Streptomyces tsukubensis]|uniref:DUF2255 domain-containing protein n=1 Tax=Streptomyces tsukubensis TaxID=83656 RepID=A0A1V4A6X6_9ACTN|nr:DUF2255 family protein [Streptomyces tsukubensis]OON76971.1 hypothetical protein B1H18_19650 [Streptomyces tsukubensis]QFR93793.1 DUF2255 family protein [Streptomyces tsukubensis]